MNSISRDCDEGTCVVKQLPQFFEDVWDFARKFGLEYQGRGIGAVTSTGSIEPLAIHESADGVLQRECVGTIDACERSEAR